jgi:hypothetical protein
VTRLANGIVAVAVLGGCLALAWLAAMTNNLPGVIAGTLTFGSFAYVAVTHSKNVRHLRKQLAARHPTGRYVMPAVEPGQSIREQLAVTRLANDEDWAGQARIEEMA